LAFFEAFLVGASMRNLRVRFALSGLCPTTGYLYSL